MVPPDERKQLTRLAAVWQEWGMGSSDANLLAERWDAEMSEERYVVRDKDGWMLASDDGEEVYFVTDEYGISEAERVLQTTIRFPRSEAVRLKRYAERDQYVAADRPLRLCRLVRKPKPKPKAPREVFLVVEPSGMLADCPPEDDREAAEENANRPGDRVVRYVLAEGEK